MSNTRKGDPVTDDFRFWDFGSGGSLFLYNPGSDGFGDIPYVPTAYERGLTRADPSEFGSALASSGLFTGGNITDQEQIQDILNPPQFAVGPGFDDQDVFKDPAEIDPAEDIGPTETLEDSIFQILMETIIGEQGIPEGVSAEVIEAIRGDFGPTAAPEQLREVAEQIAEAGGFDQWLEQQDIVLGDPGQIDEDTTQSPVETVFNEDGTITTIIDPTLITLPPLLGDPEVEGEGGGGSTAPGEEEETEEEADAIVPDYSDLVNPEFEVPEPPEGEVGIPEFYRVDEDGNVTVILDPDNPVVVDPDRVPGHVDTTTPGTYPESGYVTDEQEETTVPTPSEPSIVITPSLPGGSNAGGGASGSDQITTGGSGGGTGTGVGTGSGDGTGDGDGSGDGERKGMFEDKFTPFTTSIGYTPVQLQQLITPPKKDYMRELDGLFGRLLG